MKIELDIDDSVESLKVGDIIANKDNSIIGICTFARKDKTVDMVVLYSEDIDFCSCTTYRVNTEEWYKYKGKITISNN